MRLAPPLPSCELARIEKRLHLELNKWDTQVGDESILGAQPIVFRASEWAELCRIAERLAAEVELHEARVFEDERLQIEIGVPRAIGSLLRSLSGPPFGPVRSFRFDFHPTAEGWRVSEVNSDVPGGWREASSLPELFRPYDPGLSSAGDALSGWSAAMLPFCSGCVAFLCAPGSSKTSRSFSRSSGLCSMQE